MSQIKRLQTIDADTLQSTAYEPVSFVVDDLLPQGLHLLAGAPKIGKSWLALWLCLCAAQGKPLWTFATRPCEVLYLCLEDSFQRIQSRLFDLTEDAPPTLHFAVMSQQLHNGLVEQIEQFLKEHPATGLIVIDTLQRIRTMSNDANPYANDYRDIGVLKALADRHRIAVLLIHHLRKQSASDPFDQISGSTGLMGVADTSWVMQRKRMSQTADILLTGRDMDDRTLHLREENCIWTLEDEETAEEREIKAVPDYLWKAAEYIESVGNWQGTASELLAAAGIENAKPNQFTYNMAKYFDKVFEPKNIRYKTHRKNKVRLLSFYGDDGDGGDDDIDITQLSGWGIPERPSPSSPSSLGALEGSKHGRSVATGQPAEKPTGTAPNPCEAAGA